MDPLAAGPLVPCGPASEDAGNGDDLRVNPLGDAEDGRLFAPGEGLQIDLLSVPKPFAARRLRVDPHVVDFGLSVGQVVQPPVLRSEGKGEEGRIIIILENTNY